MKPENNLQRYIGIIISFIVILGVLFVNVFFGKQQINTSNNSQPSSNIPPTDSQAPSTSSIPISQNPPVDIPKQSVSVYKDGTYSVIGSYMSPGGYEQLGVLITLKNDIITDASVTNMAGDGRSQRYQDQFISSYQQYVIGQNIESLSLSRIAGASLTTQGFNDAISQIKSQAVA